MPGPDAANIPAIGPAVGSVAVAGESETTLPILAPPAPLPIFNPAGWGTAVIAPVTLQPSTSTSESGSRSINPQAATAPPSMILPNSGSTSTNPSLPTSTSASSSSSASLANNTIPPGVAAAIALGVIIAILIAGIGGFLYRRNRKRQHGRPCVQELPKQNERFGRPKSHPQPNTGSWYYEKELVAEMESSHPAYSKHRLFG